MLKNPFVGRIAIGLAIAVLVSGGFAAGFETGQHVPKSITVAGVKNIENPEEDADFDSFWESWDVIDNFYLRANEANDQNKVYGAIRGLVRSLNDPYSEFFTPPDNKKFQEDIQGNFSGIGAEIGIRKNQLTVIAPLKNSPAMRAGLKAADQILQINSTSTADLALDEGVRLIRGQEGTDVKLTILRDGWEASREITITRARIQVPTLDFEMRDGNVAYIQLYGFNANSGRLFYDAILRASQFRAQGLVLDLRNNPGGFLEVAVDLAGWFLPRGTLVVSENTREGAGVEFNAQGNEALKNFPLVVLINQGSASAAEILAGALQDHKKAILVGEQSFGKGTVQQLKTLTDGSSIKITIANWVLPSGKILEQKGLTPDVEVKLTDKDIEAGKDPQLDKALELVKLKIQQ